MALFSRRHDVPRRGPAADPKTGRLGMVWPCFHAGTAPPKGDMEADRKTDRLGMVWPCFHAGTAPPKGDMEANPKILDEQVRGSVRAEPGIRSAGAGSSVTAGQAA